MKRVIRRVLNQLPYILDLQSQIGRQGQYPAGHYYSPIPTAEDVQRQLASMRIDPENLLGIDLYDDEQFKLLVEYQSFYGELPFTEQMIPTNRYYYAQDWFCHADAIFLYSFLRKHKPRQIIEIGSGFSSAVMLDTAEHYLEHKPDFVFVEPFPERLLSLLKPQDDSDITLITTPVQLTDPELFLRLEPGDLLFIDSSHVLKCGSDVHHLMFEVLPRLPRGIFVHFHDVFFPFEYPPGWLKSGRYWNECYFLRSFLSYNSEWKIHFFSDYVGRKFKTFLRNELPLCLMNTGGSLYLQRLR